MIGQLTFRIGNKQHTVTLSDGLQWQCDDNEVAQDLTETFPVYPSEELSNLAVGRYLLYQTAERLGGTVEVPSRRPLSGELV